MQYKINADPKRIIGKRPNLSAQNSVADEIVSAFTSQQEQPIVPLSSVSTLPRGEKNPQGSAIAATILLFLPFVYPFAFIIHGATSGHPLPAIMYPMLVLMARLLSNIGSLVLYLAARAANYLRKPIGWVSLATLILPLTGVLLFGTQLSQVDVSTIDQTRGWLALGIAVITLLCMLALCVFAVLVLVRVFKKKQPSVAE